MKDVIRLLAITSYLFEFLKRTYIILIWQVAYVDFSVRIRCEGLIWGTHTVEVTTVPPLQKFQQYGLPEMRALLLKLLYFMVLYF